MTQLAQGYSFVMFAHTAGATYTLPFPYLSVQHIRAFAGEPGDAIEVELAWTGPTTVQVVPTIPEGMTLTIRRFTPRDKMLVNFYDGAQLPGRDLNTAAKQLLYIIQESIDFGTYGGSGLPGGGVGWPAPSGGSTPVEIQQIVDAVMQSVVFQRMVTLIDGNDTTAEVVLETLLRDNAIFDQTRNHESRLVEAVNRIVVVENESQESITQITGLRARMDSAESSIVSLMQAVSTEQDTRASAITQLQSDYQAADSALNTAISKTLQETYATKDFAQATAATQVQAFNDTTFATLREDFTAYASTNDGKWNAAWTIRINAGQINGQPVIAGIGLGVDETTGSTCVISADRFAIVHPSYTQGGALASVKFPFVVGIVGGQTQVGIDGNLMVDGTITADKLKVNSLSALTANAGTINGGTFKTYQLDANGNIIDPLEFRVEMTNVPTDNYPLWIGAGVKNANNAVFYVDRNGNASFDGTIRAPNVTGSLQENVTLNWTGPAFNAASNGTTDTFTLPAPVRLGETHVPIVNVVGKIRNTHGSDYANGDIHLQKLVGGTWVDVQVIRRGLKNLFVDSCALLAIDAPTSSSVTYRIQMTDAGMNSGSFNLESLTAYAFGLR